ncbi:predicted protein [Histoplasma capsulatum var. duboisii H88]|uniref:Predicted protein n=1 Tax=Ajellomyces capsulatus (strain H88) TaxID=544711 RepID=F0U6M8_AJEC8|nr:predicted protein [Histoplasma capsulatum var. duboisii H88]
MGGKLNTNQTPRSLAAVPSSVHLKKLAKLRSRENIRIRGILFFKRKDRLTCRKFFVESQGITLFQTDRVAFSVMRVRDQRIGGWFFLVLKRTMIGEAYWIRISRGAWAERMKSAWLRWV